jgi:bifunctional ADP-heptose synthase (sugar kinase/adenylyltransferase)
LCVEIEDHIINYLNAVVPDSSGIVISDFVYGVVTPRILEHVQLLANKYKLMLFGDVQCSSQVGLVSRLKNYTLLTPNEREARLALQDKHSGLEQICQTLIKDTNSQKLVMKLGPEGFIAYCRAKNGQLVSQAFPALSVNPLDVAGAGDSLLAIFFYSAIYWAGDDANSSSSMLCYGISC